MFQKILVPVDLADPEFVKPALDNRGGARAARRAARCGSINVIPMTPVMLAEYVPPDFDVQQRGSAEEALAIIAKESGLAADKVSTVVRQGGIYHEVLEEAKMFGCDIIVMSSHRPAMKTYFLGSNAGHMVRYAKCSVLVVRKPRLAAFGSTGGGTASGRNVPGRLRRKKLPACHRNSARNAAMKAAPPQACVLERAHDSAGERQRRADEDDNAGPVEERRRAGLERASARRPRRRAGAAPITKAR